MSDSAPPSYEHAVSNITIKGPHLVPMPLPEIVQTKSDIGWPNPDKLQSTIDKYKVSSRYVESMDFLKGLTLELVVDNSGSMGYEIDSVSYVSFSINPEFEGKSKRRRYDEAIEMVGMAIELGSHYFKNINVHFLNGIKSQYRVTNIDQIAHVLRLKPEGCTPLVPVMKKIIQHYDENKNEQAVIMVITDGVPTNEKDQPDPQQLRKLIAKRKSIDRTYITFIACTDDKETLSYLNKWDKEISNVDVVDDYKSEKEEVNKVKGPLHKFTYGDYIVKAMAGAKDPTLDKLDETKGCQCVIL